MATFAIEIGKQLPISLVKRNQYNVRGHLDPNTWVLEIHGFAIRGFSFPPKPANCKDPLLAKNLTCKKTRNEKVIVVPIVHISFSKAVFGAIAFTVTILK